MPVKWDSGRRCAATTSRANVGVAVQQRAHNSTERVWQRVGAERVACRRKPPWIQSAPLPPPPIGNPASSLLPQGCSSTDPGRSNRPYPPLPCWHYAHPRRWVGVGVGVRVGKVSPTPSTDSLYNSTIIEEPDHSAPEPPAPGCLAPYGDPIPRPPIAGRRFEGDFFPRDPRLHHPHPRVPRLAQNRMTVSMHENRVGDFPKRLPRARGHGNTSVGGPPPLSRPSLPRPSLPHSRPTIPAHPHTPGDPPNHHAVTVTQRVL